MRHFDIPEPCSEDWNKMTPNERGAFCQKCSKDVYDFTGKSSDEIKRILVQNIADPVCMRIAPKQLDDLNDDFSAWKIQSARSYQRAWIFTLLVVFGMTLFSCEEDEEPAVKEFQRIGQTILTQQNEEKTIDAKEVTDDIEQLENTSEQNEINRSKSTTKEVVRRKSRVNSDDRQEMVCDIEEVYVREKQAPVEAYIVSEQYVTAGVPISSPDFDEFLIHESQEMDLETNKDKSSNEISGIAYPNPASTQTTLSLDIPRSGRATIELFNSSGQYIRTIESGRIKKGESEYSIDLTDVKTGIYHAVIQSGRLKKTIKFSKI